jgi:2-dehydropantoate 2-reductase
VLAVAEACGIKAPDLGAEKVESIINETRQIHDQKKGTSQFKPSMLIDLECGRPMEIEVLVGNITRKAREANVETPR